VGFSVFTATPNRRVATFGNASGWDGVASYGTGSFTAVRLGHMAVVTAIDPTTSLAVLSAYNSTGAHSYASVEGIEPGRPQRRSRRCPAPDAPQG